MDLKKLIGKLLESDSLNPLERAELEGFDCESLSPENLDRLRREHAAIKEELTGLRRRAALEKLCAELHCTDPDYLEYRARREQVDMNDPEAVRRFAAGLEKTSPGCFQAHIVPGSSAGTPADDPGTSGGEGNFPGDRIGELAASIGDAPDAR